MRDPSVGHEFDADQTVAILLTGPAQARRPGVRPGVASLAKQLLTHAARELPELVTPLAKLRERLERVAAALIRALAATKEWPTPAQLRNLFVRGPAVEYERRAYRGWKRLVREETRSGLIRDAPRWGASARPRRRASRSDVDRSPTGRGSTNAAEGATG